MKTGILIFEDNNNLRESVCRLINYADDMLMLGAYPDVLQVESLVKESNPDVILMDIDMPGINGIEAVKIIRTFNSKVQIIMLTVFDDNIHVYDAIRSGASGYMLKKHISDKLLESIAGVMKGEAAMSPGIARLIIESIQQNKNLSNDYNLTKRETEILRSLSHGNSYKIIASDLFITIDTVRSHIKHIYEKLQVHSQTEAVCKAMNEKLV
ncbi:MAG TPA: response regulator transcription factor [Ferruginibacter sp.]|nr:response regulator transcription factor [Ferruginibacter sp.]